jgi:hypothetical protein
MWEGWLEFIPRDPARYAILASPVESRQPQREYLDYWASGLTSVYAEGALDRAVHPVTVRTRGVEVPATERPAPRITAAPAGSVSGAQMPLLDPFEVGVRSLEILRQELSALGRRRLVNIIAAFGLNPSKCDLSWMTDAQLIAFIVTAVDAQMKVKL